MAARDVLVIGGGIVGAACARALAARGLAVTILDSSREAGIATQASAGMLAPLAECGPDDPMMALSVRARDYYRELAPILKDESGIDVGLWTDGILTAALTEDEEGNLHNRIAWQRQQGLNADWLPADDLQRRCPGINPGVRGALLAPEDGALEPLALLEALLVSATRHGAHIARGERVEEIRLADGRVSGVGTDRGFRTAGTVVLAAGCWSGRIDGLPRPLSVEPIRGQMTAFDWLPDEPGAIVYGGRAYVLRRGSEMLAGSTMEHAGFDAGVTEEGQNRILTAAARLYPGVANQRARRAWAGLRPSTPDGRPIMGQDPEFEGLWYATGHGRNGILLAGLTGELVGQMLTGEPSEDDLTPMSPGRFWHG